MSYTVTDKFLRHAATLGYDSFGDSQIRITLYDNDVTPSASSVWNDFDIAGGGNLGDFVDGTPTTSGGQAAQSFRLAITQSGENTIYGCIIYYERVPSNPLGNRTRSLLWAHRFSSPINIANNETVSIEVEIDRIFRQV